MTTLSIEVNGAARRADVEDRTLLVDFLRDVCGLTGTHVGCDTSQCGSCVVELNGQAVKSCAVLAAQADGASVRTIEALHQHSEPAGLHPLQQAFRECHALQCGFCTPGMVMASIALLRLHPHPTRAQIVKGLEGNLCRCTGYVSIVRAIERYASSV